MKNLDNLLGLYRIARLLFVLIQEYLAASNLLSLMRFSFSSCVLILLSCFVVFAGWVRAVGTVSELYKLVNTGGLAVLTADLDMTEFLSGKNESLECKKSFSLTGELNDLGGLYVLQFREPSSSYMDGFFVFGAQGSSACFSLDKLHFQGSSTKKSAIQLLGGHLTVMASLFSDNFAESDGGAVMIASTVTELVTLTDTSFINNLSQGKGGAIVMQGYENRLQIIARDEDVLFRGNRQAVRSDLSGGVLNDIALHSGSLMLDASEGRTIRLDSGVTGTGDVDDWESSYVGAASKLIVNASMASAGTIVFGQDASLQNMYIQLFAGTLKLDNESSFHHVTSGVQESDNFVSLRGGSLDIANQQNGTLFCSTFEVFSSSTLFLDVGDKLSVYSLNMNSGAILSLDFSEWNLDGHLEGEVLVMDWVYGNLSAQDVASYFRLDALSVGKGYSLGFSDDGLSLVVKIPDRVVVEDLWSYWTSSDPAKTHFTLRQDELLTQSLGMMGGISFSLDATGYDVCGKGFRGMVFGGEQSLVLQNVGQWGDADAGMNGFYGFTDSVVTLDATGGKASLLIENSYFTSNSTSGNGAALRLLAGVSIVRDSSFYNNQSVGTGGAIFVGGGAILLLHAENKDIVFSGNRSAGGANAIHVERGFLSFSAESSYAIVLYDGITSAYSGNKLLLNESGGRGSLQLKSTAYFENMALTLYSGTLKLDSENSFSERRKNALILSGATLDVANFQQGILHVESMEWRVSSMISLDVGDSIFSSGALLLSAGNQYIFSLTGDLSEDHYTLLSYLTLGSSSLSLSDFQIVGDALDLSRYELALEHAEDGYSRLVLNLALTDEITFFAEGKTTNKGERWDTIAEDIDSSRGAWVLTVKEGGILEPKALWKVQNGSIDIRGGIWNAERETRLVSSTQERSMICIQAGGQLISSALFSLDGLGSLDDSSASCLTISGNGSYWISNGSVFLGNAVLKLENGGRWESVSDVSIALGSRVLIDAESECVSKGMVKSAAKIENNGLITLFGSVFESCVVGEGTLKVAQAAQLVVLGDSSMQMLDNNGVVFIGSAGDKASLSLSGRMLGVGELILYNGSSLTLQGTYAEGEGHRMSSIVNQGTLSFDLGSTIWAAGDYVLLDYERFSGSGSLQVVGWENNGDTRVNYFLSCNEKEKHIQLSINGNAVTLRWNQGMEGSWSLRGEAWDHGADTTDGRFFHLDHVLFDTKDAQVSLVGDLWVGLMTILEDTSLLGGALQTSAVKLAQKLRIINYTDGYKLGILTNLSRAALSLSEGSRVEVTQFVGGVDVELEAHSTLRVLQQSVFGAVLNHGTIVFDLARDKRGNGVYTLATYESWQGTGSIQLDGIVISGDSRVNYIVTNQAEDKLIQLEINGKAARLFWNQGKEGVWDLRRTEWDHDSSTNDGRFYHNDHVVFNTEDACVTLVGTLQPGSVLVQKSLSLMGGTLDCVGTLTKVNQGVLALHNLQTSVKHLELLEGRMDVFGALSVSGSLSCGKDTWLEFFKEAHSLCNVQAQGAMIIVGDAATLSFSGGNQLGELVGHQVSIREGSTQVDQVTLSELNIEDGARVSLRGSENSIGCLRGNGELILSAADVLLNVSEIVGRGVDVQLGAESILCVSGDSIVGNVSGTGTLVFQGECLAVETVGNALVRVDSGAVGVARSQETKVEISEGSSFHTSQSSSLASVHGRGLWVIGGDSGALLLGNSAISCIQGTHLELQEGVVLRVADMELQSLSNHGSLLLDFAQAKSGGTLLRVESMMNPLDSLTLYTGDGVSSILSMLGKTTTIAVIGGEIYQGSLLFAGMEIRDKEGEQLYDKDGVTFHYTYHEGQFSLGYNVTHLKPGSTPSIRWNEDGSSVLSSEIVATNKGTIALAQDTLSATLSVAGARPDQANESREIVFGSSVKVDHLDALSIVSSSHYMKEESRNPEGDATGTQFEKQGHSYGLLLSGSLKFESASEENASISHQELGFIHIAEGSKVELKHTDIVLSEVGIAVESIIVKTKLDLYDSSLQGAAKANKIVMQDSTVQGTGTLKNISFQGGKVRAGHSPGILTLDHVDVLSGVVLETSVSSKGLNNGGLNENTEETISQFAIVGSLDISQAVFKVVFDSDIVVSQLGEGLSFKFFDLSQGSLVGDFAQMIMPRLSMGKYWDFDAATGIVTLRYESVEQGARFANSLWTSGAAVLSFSAEMQNQMQHAIEGKTSMWLASMNDVIKASSQGGVAGYDYDAQGYAVGALRALPHGHVLGLAFCSFYGKHKPQELLEEGASGKIKQDSFMLGIHAKTSLSKQNEPYQFSLDISFAYADVSNDSSRSLGSRDVEAKWSDSIYSAGLQMNFLQMIEERTSLNLFMGLDTVYGTQESISEDVGQILNYQNGAYCNTRVKLGCGITHRIEFANGMALTPRFNVSYAYDLLRVAPHVDVQELFGESRVSGLSPRKSSIMCSPSLIWQMNSSWSLMGVYTLRIREGMQEHNMNASVSYAF